MYIYAYDVHLCVCPVTRAIMNSWHLRGAGGAKGDGVKS